MWAVAAQDALPLEPLSVDEAVFFVETDVGSGIAFLVEGATGGVWMVSTSSVFEGAKEYSITNASGEQIAFPEQVMVASDRDLIRFPTDRPAGLKRTESCEFEEDILTFSKCDDGQEEELIVQFESEKKTLEERKENLEKEKGSWVRKKEALEKTAGRLEEEDWSAILELLESRVVSYDAQIEDVADRLGVIDEEIKTLENKKQEQADAASEGIKLSKGFLLRGNVVALGPDRIEISALVTEHDRGGPVVNMHQEVVGISSHLDEGAQLPDWVIEGTRFEDDRRFALKLERVEWTPMARRIYRKETRFVRETFAALAVFAHITESLDDNYLEWISVSTENRDVQEWLDRHNKLAEKYSEAKRERFRSSSQVDHTVRYLERNIAKDFEALAEMVEELEKDAGRKHRVSTPFYKERLTDLEKLYRNVRERMEQIVENL